MKVTIKRGQESMSSLPYLLSVALIVPTLLLLWFMFRTTQAEEKLIQDNLLRAYENQLQSGVSAWQARMTGSLPTPLPDEAATTLDQDDNAFVACLIFNKNFDQLYPAPANQRVPRPRNYDAAFYQENAGNFEAASKSYLQQIQSADHFESAINAWSGYLRTLFKSGDESAFKAAAATFIQNAGDDSVVIGPADQPRFLGNLLYILKKAPSQELHQAVLTLLVQRYVSEDSLPWMAYKPELAFFIPAMVNALADTLEDSSGLELLRHWAKKQSRADEQYQSLRDSIANESKDSAPWRPLAEPGYHFTHREKNRLTYVYIVLDAYLRNSLHDALAMPAETATNLSILTETDEIPESDSGFRILTDLDEQVPGWRLVMTIDPDNAFGGSHARQRWVMLISGSLVILFILFIGSWVLASLSRQIRLNRLKNDFIGTVTHELKTPLASTRLLVDTLIDSPLENKERIRRYLGQISRSNERLSVLIDNFLTFSRMERGKVQLSYDAVDPVDIGKQALDSVQPYLDEAHCELQFNFADQMPACRANPEALITILVNFLSNACKYSRDDKRIELLITEQDEYIHFSVKDHGLGIPRNQQKRIFDRFYQIDNKLSRKAEGSGLGLSIVKYLVDAHQGKVFLDSTPGLGSTFTAAIPKA